MTRHAFGRHSQHGRVHEAPVLSADDDQVYGLLAGQRDDLLGSVAAAHDRLDRVSLPARRGAAERAGSGASGFRNNPGVKLLFQVTQCVRRPSFLLRLDDEDRR